MRLLFCLLVVCWMVPLPAQETYFARLANEVCSCMERISVEPVERQATNCLREVALANEESLRKRYNLLATEASQRDLLADRLAGNLLRDCPLLATLNYEWEEELRWSDREQPLAPEPVLFSSAKGPPADPQDSITGEHPPEWLAEGSVQRISGGKLILQLTSGKMLELELPTAILRSSRLKIGDNLKLSYRREWRREDNRIVSVVLEIRD